MNPWSTHSRYWHPVPEVTLPDTASGIQKNGTTSNPPAARWPRREPSIQLDPLAWNHHENACVKTRMANPLGREKTLIMRAAVALVMAMPEHAQQ